MRLLLLTLVAGVLAFAHSAPVAKGGPANTIAELPLKRGFYVTSDTACDNASNATLLLVHADGMNGARTACDFKWIEQIGSTSYRTAMVCTDIQGEEPEHSTCVYEIPDSTQFSYGSEDSDYRRRFHYCEQSSLPEPWRDNDISDLIGRSQQSARTYWLFHDGWQLRPG